MPEGTEVDVQDGIATIRFTDPALRGPALANLFAVGTPPDQVTKRSRPTPNYSVPVEYAKKAGLIDGVDGVVPDDDPIEDPNSDDGFPDMDWKRPAINQYAAEMEPPFDVSGEQNKQDALDAIKAELDRRAAEAAAAEEQPTT